MEVWTIRLGLRPLRHRRPCRRPNRRPNVTVPLGCLNDVVGDHGCRWKSCITDDEVKTGDLESV